MYFKILALDFSIYRKRLQTLLCCALCFSGILSYQFYARFYLSAAEEYRVIPSFWDTLASIYEGIYPFYPSQLDYFRLPIGYLFTFILLLLIAGNTTAAAFEPYGYTIFTRLPNRQIWWLSRCGWSTIAAMLYWCALLAAAVLFSVFTGASFSRGAYRGAAVPNMASSLGIDNAQAATLLFTPLLVFVAIALLQQFLELMGGSVFGFIGIFSFVVSGAFLNTPLLYCNHIMMLRSAGFSKTGTTFQQTLCYTGITALGCIIAGCGIIRKKDILS